MKAALAGVLVLAACGGDDFVDGPHDAPPAPDASACPRDPAAADRQRLVVVSHPYATPPTTYQVLTLDTDGALTDAGTTFELGRSLVGEMAFTPDGEVGIVAQDDGTLGVVRFDGATPAVVHAAFQGSFYASRVVMDPRGDRAYVLDGNTALNGGGAYEVGIGCDGTLEDRGKWSNDAHGLAAGLLVPAQHGPVLITSDIPDTVGDNVLQLADDGGVFSSGDAFGDGDAIVGGTALALGGQLALIGDVSQFSGVPNRVAVVNVNGAPTPIQELTPIEDPIAIVVSPTDDVALVVSGFGDAIFVLDRSGTTFTNRGELSYVGASPQLPGGAVLVERGALAGLVLVAENLGIRRVRLAGGGTVTDLGRFALGAGSAAITGSIGVQP